ncbi:hypothetical protein PIB30_096377 [Stylosanthes scabra]|uniref:Uncharacterized protein n=1 Tax=Stylosanthes scabra TaxID=79078 RepID=A0ABU6VZ42_9FABA|nr:hypothetical protein [Stylosanthes scabra]
MKKGSLQRKKRSLEAKQSKNSTHMRGGARICMLLHTHPRLSNSVTLRRGTLASSFPRICVELQAYAWETNSPRVEDPCICVEGTLAASNHAESTPKQLYHAYAWEANKLTFQSHVYTTSNVTFTSPSLIHPRIGVEDPRICMEGTLVASNHARPTYRRGSPSICVESSLITFKAHVWMSSNVTLPC